MRKSAFPLIALAVFLIFLLSACGGDEDDSGPPPTPRAGTQQFGTPYNDTGYGLALDGSGNIYIAGLTGGNLDGNTSAGLLDIFLTKFGSSGNRIGSKQFGTPGDDIAYAIAIDTSGNIYITGSTGGNLGATSAGGLDIFLAKFDSSGNRIFIQQFGTNQDDIGYGVGADNSGNIYITGSTKGILGSGSLGLLDVFLAKFNSSWVNQFIVQFGSDRDDVGYSVALSGTDNIYITGSTGGNLPGNTSSGLTDIFLAKFNSSGASQFLHQLGTTGRDVGNSVAVDSVGYVYVVGSTEGGLLGNIAFGLSDIFLVKFNSSGVTQFARQLGTPGNDIAYGVAIQGTGIYITGSTEGNLDGNTSFGQADIFLVKYDTSGVKK